MLDTTPGGYCNRSELVGVLRQGGLGLKNFKKKISIYFTTFML
jgi:hypothetical protein